jgi:hypothetical protein
MSRWVYYRTRGYRYLWNNLIALDQVINTLLGGDPDETMSSRLGKHSRQSCVACYWICRALHLLEAEHCAKSIERDRGSRDVIK